MSLPSKESNHGISMFPLLHMKRQYRFGMVPFREESCYKAGEKMASEAGWLSPLIFHESHDFEGLTLYLSKSIPRAPLLKLLSVHSPPCDTQYCNTTYIFSWCCLNGPSHKTKIFLGLISSFLGWLAENGTLPMARQAYSRERLALLSKTCSWPF